MNSGNVSGQYVELLRAVVGKLPRDFKWTELDWLTQHTAELGQFLEGMKGIVPTRFDFEVPVVYGPLEDVMEFCGVTNCCPSAGIPIEQEDEKVKKFSLLRCKPDDADVCMKKNGLRHASLCEVASASRIPFVKHCCVVAGGSAFFPADTPTIKRFPYVCLHHTGQSSAHALAKFSLEKWDDLFFAGVED